MSWEDQGRQEHGWFGHDTAPDKGKQTAPDPSVLGQSEADRALALAYGALASLPPAQRRQVEAQYHNGTLPRLREALTAWLRATALDRASFGSRLFGRSADDPVVRDLHRAASRAATAESHDDLRDAAEKLAKAMQGVGIDRWPGFVADAAERARDPATRAAIEGSKQPPSPDREAIRPVYPLETAIGVAAAGLAGGAAAAARAARGAFLRQVLPGGRSQTENAALPQAGRNASAETPPNTSPSEKPAEPIQSGQSVRLHEGQQDKHIEGTNNYIPSRSTLTADPRALLQRFAGRGQQVGRIPVGQAGSKEVFDAGEFIGTYRTQAGLSAPTTRGMIHHSGKGAHIVPAAPRNWQP